MFRFPKIPPFFWIILSFLCIFSLSTLTVHASNIEWGDIGTIGPDGSFTPAPTPTPDTGIEEEVSYADIVANQVQLIEQLNVIGAILYTITLAGVALSFMLILYKFILNFLI